VTAIETRVGAVPVPLRATSCGLDTPVSAIVRIADRDASAVGPKETETVQLAEAANVAGLIGQVFVVT
jgi:hypothetical protein